MTLTDLLVAIIVVAMLAPPVTFAWDAFAKRHPYLTDDILDWWDYRRAMLHDDAFRHMLDECAALEEVDP